MAKAVSVLLANIQVLREELESEMLKEIQSIQNVRREVDISLLQAEIENLNSKKRKTIDLMLEGLISKDDIKQQTEFYDSEITRITKEIAENKNASLFHKKQMDGIKSAIERIKNVADCDINNTEIYGEMLEKVIVASYQNLHIYLNGILTGFHLTYTVKKAPRIGTYDIIIDSCEIIP